MSERFNDLAGNWVAVSEIGSELTFGTGDFTFLMRVHPLTVTYGAAESGVLLSRNFTAYELFIYQGFLNGYVGGTSNAPGQIAIATGSWAAVGMRRSGSSLRLWKDNSFGSAATNSSAASGSGILYFGNRPPGTSTTLAYDGYMRDVGMWNIALSDDDLASYFKGSPAKRIRPQSLVLAMPMARAYPDIRQPRSVTNGAFGPAANDANPRIYGF